MKLTEKQIDEINFRCDYLKQGIFKEPFGIPNNIKELVIYTKYRTGYMPGSSWDSVDTINEYEKEYPSNKEIYKVFKLALKTLKPEIFNNLNSKELEYFVYDIIKPLLYSNTKTEYGYYGDYEDFTIEWVILSDLYKYLKRFDYIKK